MQGYNFEHNALSSQLSHDEELAAEVLGEPERKQQKYGQGLRNLTLAQLLLDNAARNADSSVCSE